MEGVHCATPQGGRVAPGQLASSRPRIGRKVFPLPYTRLQVPSEVCLDSPRLVNCPTFGPSRNRENDTHEFRFTKRCDHESWMVLLDQ